MEKFQYIARLNQATINPRHGNVENCFLCRWKTHSQPMEKGRSFPQPANRFPTATPKQAVYAHSHNAYYCEYPSSPFLSVIKRKRNGNKKREYSPRTNRKAVLPFCVYRKWRNRTFFPSYRQVHSRKGNHKGSLWKSRCKRLFCRFPTLVPAVF